MRDAMALWECSSKYIISDAHSLFFIKNLCYDRPFLPQSEHKFHNSPRVNGGYCVRVPSEPWVVIVYYKRIFLCQLFWNQMSTRNHKKIERQTVLAQTKLISRTRKRAMLNIILIYSGFRLWSYVSKAFFIHIWLFTFWETTKIKVVVIIRLSENALKCHFSGIRLKLGQRHTQSSRNLSPLLKYRSMEKNQWRQLSPKGERFSDNPILF